MASIFTRIINGEIPSYKIAENDQAYAFLDINPLRPGHTLVVPKKEVDYIYDLDDDTLGELFLFSKKIAKAIEPNFDCERVGVCVIGLEVPHAHIHLIPINGLHDMDFSRPKLNLTTEDFLDIAKRIKSSL